MAGEDELKMWLVVRDDLPEMTAEKLATQSGHAFQELGEVARERDPELWRRYRANSMPKIIVRAPNAAGLDRVCREAETAGIPALSITDEGRTCFAGPTMTVAVFGPATRAALPKYLARLQVRRREEPSVPEDFVTHRDAWRSAIVAMRDTAEPRTEDTDERGYWEHELRAFDRAYAEMGMPHEEAGPNAPKPR